MAKMLMIFYKQMQAGQATVFSVTIFVEKLDCLNSIESKG